MVRRVLGSRPVFQVLYYQLLKLISLTLMEVIISYFIGSLSIQLFHIFT